MGAVRHSMVGGLRALVSRPLSTLMAVGSIALSMLLAGTVYLASSHLKEFSSKWASGVVVAVYLAPKVTVDEVERVRRALLALPGRAKVRFVPQKAALDRLRQNLGADAKLLKGVEARWLPSSFQVTLRGRPSDLLEAQKRLASLGRALPAVEEVRTLTRFQRRLHSIARLTTYAGSVLLVLTILTCGYVVAVTVRLGLFARQEEIEVQRLLGATRAFVVAPMLVEGGLKAFLGAVAAVGLLYGLNAVIVPRIVELAGPGPAVSALRFVPWPVVAGAVGLTTLAGLFGSGMAVGRHART